MIHVTIYYNKRKECTGFTADGHAGYESEGRDIVCAAASVLMINTVNAVEALTHENASVSSDEETGRLDFHVGRNPSRDAVLLLNSMILGLKSMVEDENYAKYIQLTFEEVQEP